MTTNDETRDSWGFGEAEHFELQALMRRHDSRVFEAIRLAAQDGMVAASDDPDMIGFLARAFPEANVRIFPHGGFWWSLLEHLRALDDHAQGVNR